MWVQMSKDQLSSEFLIQLLGKSIGVSLLLIISFFQIEVNKASKALLIWIDVYHSLFAFMLHHQVDASLSFLVILQVCEELVLVIWIFRLVCVVLAIPWWFWGFSHFKVHVWRLFTLNINYVSVWVLKVKIEARVHLYKVLVHIDIFASFALPEAKNILLGESLHFIKRLHALDLFFLIIHLVLLNV